MSVSGPPNRILDRFRQRSGRVVSVSRLALAAIFMLTLAFGENLPRVDERTVLILLTLYVGWAAFVMTATWQDWWYDFAIAWPAHLVDILVFGAVVYLTQGYTSPFYIFSVFLILTATLRWTWRQTGLTAAAVVVMFLIAGLAASIDSGSDLNILRVLLRTTNLVVLSLLLIWFGITQERSGPVPQPEEYVGEEAPSQPPAGEAVAYALTRIPADVALFAWWEREEPWVHVWEQDANGVRRDRLGPDELGDIAEPDRVCRPFLFDLTRGRSLTRPERGRTASGPLPPIILADRLERRGYTQGTAVCIRSAFFSGQLVVAGGDGPCLDQLSEAADVSEQISTLFDRYSVLNLSARRAVDEAKVTLARDLHDGVIQVLSGTSFRLEALRSWIRAGRDPDEEISAIQQALAREQQNVRGFIRRLQAGRGAGQLIDLRASLQELMDQLCANWA
ncbi:MAG TPA: histidine kinase dimerization/phosphoacceptor domain-containing protein, partial [Allosphingosinicella sp.]